MGQYFSLVSMFFSILFQWLVYSHVWIGLSAVMLYLQTLYLTFNENKVDWIYASLLGLGAIIVYSIHRVISMKRYKELPNRYLFHNENREILNYFSISILFVFIYLATLFDIKGLTYYLLVCLIITSLYIFPIKKGAKRLRDIGYIKIIFVGLVWTILTSIAPLLVSTQEYNLSWFLGFSFFERFIFIVSITIPFDIKDYNLDKLTNTKTLVHAIGIKRSKNLSIGLLSLSFFLSLIMFFMNYYSLFGLIGIAIRYLLGLIVLSKVTQSNSCLYFYGLIDGLILIGGIIIVGLSSIQESLKFNLTILNFISNFK